MSKSISQIYQEAVITRNNYLQLTPLEPSLLSRSKMSILDLITYVVSVAIYSYQLMLSKFQVDVITLLNQRTCGTAEYYLRIAKLFQINPTTGRGDALDFDENTLQLQYQTPSKDRQIIKFAAYEYPETDEERVDLILKVAKQQNGVNCQLSDEEKVDFQTYIDTVKFVGTKIKCISAPSDNIKIVGSIYYDNRYITKNEIKKSVENALSQFASDFGFNSYVYYQRIVDTIRDVKYITDVDGAIRMYIQSFKNTDVVPEYVEFSNNIKPYSGYINFANFDTVCQIEYIPSYNNSVY